MTKQEKIIVSAYTGVLMCDFSDVHEYIEKKLGRPVYTHELADKSVWKKIEEKSKGDFLEICKRDDPDQRWIPVSETVDVPEHEVLACDKYGTELIGFICEKDEQWMCESDECFMYDVVAYMPLPEPYKGDTDGQP